MISCLLEIFLLMFGLAVLSAAIYLFPTRIMPEATQSPGKLTLHPSRLYRTVSVHDVQIEDLFKGTTQCSLGAPGHCNMILSAFFCMDINM